MKYLCLAYYDEKKFETLTEADDGRDPAASAGPLGRGSCNAAATCWRSARSPRPGLQ